MLYLCEKIKRTDVDKLACEFKVVWENIDEIRVPVDQKEHRLFIRRRWSVFIEYGLVEYIKLIAAISEWCNSHFLATPCSLYFILPPQKITGASQVTTTSLWLNKIVSKEIVLNFPCWLFLCGRLALAMDSIKVSGFVIRILRYWED